MKSEEEITQEIKELLKKIDGSKNKEEADQLTKSLVITSNSPSMQSLVLINHPIGDKAARALGEALRHNIFLQILVLANCKIGKNSASFFGDALKSNTKLQGLYLTDNWIQEDGALALSEGLKSNTALQILDLANCRIGEKGCLALSEVLKSNSFLLNLNLANCEIGKKGFLSLNEVLKSNSSLVGLDLGYNKAESRSFLAFCEGLKSNTTLQRLDLGTCNIEDKGALALSEVLKINTSLHSIDLKYNKIGEEGFLALSRALKSNTSLLNLSLSDVALYEEVGNKAQQEINTLLTRNRKSFKPKLEKMLENSFEQLHSLSVLDAQKLFHLGKIEYQKRYQQQKQTIENLLLQWKIVGGNRDNYDKKLSILIKNCDTQAENLSTIDASLKNDKQNKEVSMQERLEQLEQMMLMPSFESPDTSLPSSAVILSQKTKPMVNESSLPLTPNTELKL